MNLAKCFIFCKQTSLFIILMVALLPVGCVSTSKRISAGDAGDRFEDRLDVLVNELLANRKAAGSQAPAAVMPGSLKSGRQYTRLEELTMERLTLKLRKDHDIYELSTQNWFEFREGRPLTFQNKSLKERDLLRNLTIYEVTISPEDTLGKVRSQITAQNQEGRYLPGVIANMELDFKPGSPAHRLYNISPNNVLYPEGLEERPYTSLDRMAYSLAADLTDSYRNGIMVGKQQAADEEIQVLLYAKPGNGISAEQARSIQEAIQQAIVSSPGFTCVLSREDFGTAVGQLDFYRKNKEMFDMQEAKFKAGTVLLMADIARHTDPGKAGVALRAVWQVSPLESETGDLIPTNVSGTYLSGFTAKAYLSTANLGYSPRGQRQGNNGRPASFNALPGRGFE